MYDARWSRKKECHELVYEQWRNKFGGSHAYRFCEKMKTLRRTLKAWYRGNGRNSKILIQQLKSEIRETYSSNGFSFDKVKKKEIDLRIALKEEEAYWRAKSRTQWLQEGDKNTKFFHAQTIKRRRFNQIRGIENSHGFWHETESGICATASTYFVELFQTHEPS